MGCFSSLVIILLISTCIVHSWNETEVCQLGIFSSTCEKNSVLWVDRASYGRMSLGRCPDRDFGFIGCQADVTSQLRSACTATASCNYTVAQLSSIVQPCPQDLMSYLLVQHICIKVENSLSCEVPQPFVVTTSSGYISSIHTKLTGSATSQCPVSIPAEPYQTVNISITSFAPADFKPVEDCHQDIVFHGKGFLQKDSLCTHMHKFYTFEGEVAVHFEGDFDESMRYLVHFKVLGCAAPKLQDSAKFEQLSKDRGVIKCGASMWYITCDGSIWHGYIGNCSTDDENDKAIVLTKGEQHKPDDGMSLPFGWLLFIVAGFLLGLILLSSLIILLLFFQSKRKRNQKQHDKGQHLVLIEGTGEETNAKDFGECRHGESVAYYTFNRDQHQPDLRRPQSPCSHVYSSGKPQTLPRNATNMSPKHSKHAFSTFKPADDDVYSMYLRRGLQDMPNLNMTKTYDGKYVKDSCPYGASHRPDLIENTSEEAKAEERQKFSTGFSPR